MPMFPRLAFVSKRMFAVCVAGGLFCLSTRADVRGDSTLRDTKIGGVTIRQSNRQTVLNSAVPRQVVSIDEMRNLGYANTSDALKHMTGVTLRLWRCWWYEDGRHQGARGTVYSRQL